MVNTALNTVVMCSDLRKRSQVGEGADVRAAPAGRARRASAQVPRTPGLEPGVIIDNDEPPGLGGMNGR